MSEAYIKGFKDCSCPSFISDIPIVARTNKIEIYKDGFSYEIFKSENDNFEILSNSLEKNLHLFSNSALQLIYYITHLFASYGHNGVIHLDINKYWECKGKPSKKDFKSSLLNDLSTLQTTPMKFTSGSGQKKRLNSFTIINDYSLGLNDCVIYLDRVFSHLAQSFPIVPFPDSLWLHKGAGARVAMLLNAYLHNQKRMNLGKRNENYHSIKTLCKKSGLLPPSGELKDRHYHERVIDPLLKGLQSLMTSFKAEIAKEIIVSDKNETLPKDAIILNEITAEKKYKNKVVAYIPYDENDINDLHEFSKLSFSEILEKKIVLRWHPGVYPIERINQYNTTRREKQERYQKMVDKAIANSIARREEKNAKGLY